MRLALFIAGVLIALLGAHWIGQGTGTLVWPANPVMDNHIEWAVYGAVSIGLGSALIFFSRRMGHKRE